MTLFFNRTQKSHNTFDPLWGQLAFKAYSAVEMYFMQRYFLCRNIDGAHKNRDDRVIYHFRFLVI